jgi:hypothetical protein
LLPELPEESVSVGATWSSEREILSLEGWAWAGGILEFQHQVRAIDRSSDHVIVSIESFARGMITAADGRRGFIGEGNLEQSIEWKFDATGGQLLSLSMEREASGSNQLPQGEVSVRQLTRYQLEATD